MKLRILFILMVVLILPNSYVNACEDPAPRAPDACNEYSSKRLIAIKSGNWALLEKCSVEFIENGCGKSYGDAELSKAYADVSKVLRHQNHYKEALDASIRGTTIFYNEPDSHLEKALALISLNMLKKAQIELDITELLSKLALKRYDLDKLTGHLSNDQTAERKQDYKKILNQVKDTRKIYFRGSRRGAIRDSTLAKH